MNNIKLLYNVFKTMKEKDVFKGTLNAEAVKKGEKTLSLNKEFETNTSTGEAKIKMNTEASIGENKIKSENSMEFNMKNCEFHKFHGMHHRGMNMEGHEHGFEHCGIKNGLNKITFMLGVLGSIKSEEKENVVVLSMDLKDMIKEVKAAKSEHFKEISKLQMERDHGHHKFMKELFDGEYEEADLRIWINKNNEVEKVVILANGTDNTSFNATLNFAW